jgi:hypothetical protein
MTTKILSTLLAALLAPIPMLILVAVLIVAVPIAPFYIVFYIVRKELRLRRERKHYGRIVRAAVAMRNAALSQYNPTNN